MAGARAPCKNIHFAHCLTMAPLPSIIVGNSLLKGSVVANEEWRSFGEARRRELLENDKEGRSFTITRSVSLKRYVQIGDRVRAVKCSNMRLTSFIYSLYSIFFIQVLSQFKALYERRSNLEEIYVMGNRLVVYYTDALPRHQDYRSIDPSISHLREKTICDLDWIRKRLDVISLRIDEEQLNLHIQKSESNDDTVQQSDTNTPIAEDNEESSWESFSGWSVDFVNDDNKSVNDTPENSHDHVDDPADILDLDSDDETDDVESDYDSLSDIDSDERAVRFDFAPETHLESSFLRVIASEEVEFEEDSEAVDSWAQDDQSLESLIEHAPTIASTHTIEYSDAGNRVTRESSYHIAPNSTVIEPADTSSEVEAENVDPAAISFSPAKETTLLTLCSYPSFDEPPEDGKQRMTSSPQDVMNFEAHGTCHSPRAKRSVRFNDEEILIPGLRI
jgi:hypothetical protein